MKNIITILIGIIIGSSSTFLIQRNRASSKTTVLNEINGVNFGGMEVTDLSTDNLHIGNWDGGNILTIASKKNPKMRIMISTVIEGDEDQCMMSSIGLQDASGVQVDFNDRNSDGIWDDMIFSNEKILCTYGRMSGYPDTILNDDDKPLVRIGDDYFQTKRIDGKNFIERDGELVELEYIKYGSFKIKESEPVN